MSHEYDVALSFAGEDRAFVKRVADILQKNEINVFYDEYEKVKLWGKDLYTHLDEVYRNKSRYCIIFISKHYKEKLWTNHERESAQARAFSENQEYILPFKLDATDIPGVRPTTGYLSLKDTDEEALAFAIIEKLGERQTSKPETLTAPKNKLLEAGIIEHENGETEIRITKIEFFGRRLASAFPGVRGLKWFEDPKFIVERLKVLFKYPLAFSLYPGFDEELGGISTPIWWFRGGSSMHINSFEILSETKCLIGWDELELKRVAVYRSRSNDRSFIYVETFPESLISEIEDSPETFVSNQLEYKEYASQEYAVYKGIPVRREEFDDGYALINKEVVDIFEAAQVRVRFLTSYNFIICAQSSPYNSREGDTIWGDFLEEALRTGAVLEDWLKKMEDLEPKRYGRSEFDFG